MLDIPRLTVARQRRVAQSLKELSVNKEAVKALHADVRSALTTTVAAGARLDGGHVLPPLVVDNASDAVLGAFDDHLESIDRGLNDKVVPLTPEHRTDPVD